jgi:hypothetical protein
MSGHTWDATYRHRRDPTAARMQRADGQGPRRFRFNFSNRRDCITLRAQGVAPALRSESLTSATEKHRDVQTVKGRRHPVKAHAK